MNRTITRFFVAAFAVLAASSHPAWAAPAIPLEAFAQRPLVERATLSPDGKKVAMLVNIQGTSTIVAQDIDAQGAPKVSLTSTDNLSSRFSWFRWVNDERLLIGTTFPSKRTVNATSTAGGVKLYDTRLLSVRADGKDLVNLMKPSTFKGYWLPQFQDRVIDFTPDGGKHVYLSLSEPQTSLDGAATGRDPAVFSVDVVSGERRHIHTSREKFATWVVDRNHQVRLGVRRENAKIEIHVCDPDGSNWRKLWSYAVFDKEAVRPLGFGQDPNELYILADHDGFDALFTVDLRDPALKRTLKLSRPGRDLAGNLVYSKRLKEVVGFFGGNELDGAQSNYWHPELRALVASIDQTLPGRFNHIISMSDDETRYLVYSSNAQTPGQIYLGDTKNNSMGLLALSYPQLNAQDMATKKSVTINARDGLSLPAFLTLPKGAEPKQLPTVVLVHGGPQSHDESGFDQWAQFLANRGYAVVQVNFRGSTGFGRKLMTAGLKRWGKEVQDDLTDAAQWAVSNGTADPKRICIVGASFGGYAALMGAAKAPDLFRCAASFAGVSDLNELLKEQWLFEGGKEVAALQIGSTDQDAESLRATSPRYLASAIKVPVLLIHGTEDRSVGFQHSEWMADALGAAAKQHRFVQQQGGDHHLSLYAHRLQFFQELEQFLAQNLDATVATASGGK